MVCIVEVLLCLRWVNSSGSRNSGISHGVVIGHLVDIPMVLSPV
jgi:hypothetical protein